MQSGNITTISASSGSALYRIAQDGTVQQHIGWRDLSSPANEGPCIGLTVSGEGDVYKLQSNGYISHLRTAAGERGADWDLIDTNPDSMTIAATFAHIYQLHRQTGHVYKYSGQGTTWDFIGGTPETVAIVADIASGDKEEKVYKLHQGGSIWKWKGEGTDWDQIDNNPETKLIAAFDDKVYQMHNSGAIWVYKDDTSQWVNLDSSPDAIQISVGKAGLYQLHKEHTIWKYLGEGEGWKEIISSDSTVVEISVGDFVYARKEAGEVIKYLDENWVPLI
ncbi:hypothetical protein NP233_g10330 [Leucocoprinus birnbaumii]|uniref:Uncharacterized protein n=1 Tax=Leucocoprinus birnbaumii TaxID=56174 RepID=A0AAD5YLE7_9AGAR|nr:hypothetical protein NP233_g10330 [Leucocoprinus birnbaumii]